MARQNINLGTSPNSGTGDNLRTAMDKVNDNFIEVYTAGPVGSNIVISGNTISANVTNANIELSPDGTGKVVVKNDVIPDANNLRYLGSANLRYRGIYVGTAGINTSGDITVGNILPSANVTYNLGSPTQQWQTLYVSGNTIYLDGQPLRVSGNTLSVNGGNVLLDGDVDLTGYATESYVDTAITNVIGGAPGALDTLNELAAALNDDAAFNSTITNSLANKANVADIPTHTSNLTNDSGFITSYTVTSSDVTAHQANLSITESQISDLQNYLTSYTVTSSDVTQHQGNITAVGTLTGVTTSGNITGVDTADASAPTSYTIRAGDNTGGDLFNAANGGTLTVQGGSSSFNPGGALNLYGGNGSVDGAVNIGTSHTSIINVGVDIDMGTNTITDTKVGQWDTAYGWGDHSTQGYLTSYTVTSGDVTAHQGNITAVGTLGSLTVSGNITAGNILTDNYYYANGAPFVSSDYSDSNVTTLLSSFGSNTISTTGNITAANFIGNVTLTGNVTGSSANVELVAGSYTWTFDNTGNTSIANGTVTANNLTLTGNIDATVDGYSIGYLEVPQVTLSANTTASLDDSGKHFYSTTAGDLSILIPTNANVAFPIGSAFTVVVQASGNVQVNADSGVTLYMAGNATSGNRVVGTYGMATIMKVGTDTWFINGTSVS